jgi:hypothetical protein
MRYLIVMIIMLCMAAAAAASVIPLASYSYMEVDRQAESAIWGGFIVESGEGRATTVEEVDYLLASVLYGNYRYAERLEFDHPEEFHSINAMVNYKRGAHEILAAVMSDSADPFENKHTFQAGAVYGYTFAYSERFSLVLGGGLLTGNGFDLLPAPYIIVEYANDILSARFDMITDPSLNITFMPKSKLSLLLDARTAKFDLIDYVVWTAAVQYKPFTGDMEFITFSAGVKGDGHEFDSRHGETAYLMNSYSAFAEADLGLLKLGGGYVFDSNEIYTNDNEVTQRGAGTGYYLSVQAMYAF